MNHKNTGERFQINIKYLNLFLMRDVRVVLRAIASILSRTTEERWAITRMLRSLRVFLNITLYIKRPLHDSTSETAGSLAGVEGIRHEDQWLNPSRGPRKCLHF